MRVIYDLHGFTGAAVLMGLVSSLAFSAYFLAIFLLANNGNVRASAGQHPSWLLGIFGGACVFCVFWVRAMAGRLPRSSAIVLFLTGIGAVSGASLGYWGVARHPVFLAAFLAGGGLLILAAEAFFPDPEVD